MADSTSGAKPKGKFVPSRYKQAAESFIIRSNENTFSTTIQTQNKNTTRQPKSLNSTELNSTVYKKKTSTPTNCNNELPSFDFCTSMLLDPPTLPTINKELPTMPKVPAPLLPITSTGKKVSHTKRPDKPKKVTSSTKDLDAEIDIHYAQYQLTLLLENKAKRSFQEKSKTAMKKIDEALCYIKVLLAEHADIKVANDLVSFTMKCHEHLKTQEDISLPLINLLEDVKIRYEEIAVAIDNVRHKLSVENVPIPESGSENEIIKEVDNINSLLDQILSTVNGVEDIAHSSEAASSFVTKAQILTDEIKRGSELLAESRDLLLSETSHQVASLTLD